MQEKGRLALGIDLCDDITQVTVMRPRAAEPEAVCFDVRARKEFLPTVLCVGQSGVWSVGEPKGKEDAVIANFFHKAVMGEEVFCNDAVYAGEELLGRYLNLLFCKIKEYFREYDIGAVAITCEELNTNEKARERLHEVLKAEESFCRHYCMFSHMEAFLHFAIRQEESLWEKGSAAFDYAKEGLLFYRMECCSAGGRRLVLADYRNYSEVIPADFTKSGETERVALTFERLAEQELKKNVASLFVTGREFDGEWVGDVLRLLSGGRRVFRGENLYTQGACYAAAEELKGERSAEFSLLLPDQISSDVYLMAETAEQENEVRMAGIGEHYREVQTEVEVLLDTTDRVSFKIVPAGRGKEFLLRVAPGDLELRSDRTSRYLVRVSFVRRDCMVIQIKDVGFGEFYPASHRIYEELVELSQLEG